jgi:hypothetical protein
VEAFFIRAARLKHVIVTARKSAPLLLQMGISSGRQSMAIIELIHPFKCREFGFKNTSCL